MTYTLFENKVFVFLKNSKGEYLFLKHKKGSLIEGYSNPPTGHLEPGETVIEAVRREVFEETGIEKLENIEVKGMASVLGFKDNPFLVLIVTADVSDDQIAIEKDEGEPFWTKAELINKHNVLADVEKYVSLINSKREKLFYVMSIFENKKLISFKVDGKEY